MHIYGIEKNGNDHPTCRAERRHRLQQQIFRPMLSRCGENEHHFLVSQLKRKRFQPETIKYICVCVCIMLPVNIYVTYMLLSIMLSVYILIMLYIIYRRYRYILSLYVYILIYTDIYILI